MGHKVAANRGSAEARPLDRCATEVIKRAGGGAEVALEGWASSFAQPPRAAPAPDGRGGRVLSAEGTHRTAHRHAGAVDCVRSFGMAPPDVRRKGEHASEATTTLDPAVADAAGRTVWNCSAERTLNGADERTAKESPYTQADRCATRVVLTRPRGVRKVVRSPPRGGCGAGLVDSMPG